MSDGMVFCRACGGSMHSTAPLCPHCGAPQARAGAGDGIARTFGTSVSMCFRKYATFAGRAPRGEYWWFLLFILIVEAVLGAIASQDQNIGGVLYGLFALGILLPSISVLVRRLHDIDRSGWWYWIALVPLVGVILLIVWLCTKGTRGDNRFGPENGLIS